jgi:hypothetical protein
MTALPVQLLCPEENKKPAWIVVCRPKLPYVTQLKSFLIIVQAFTEKEAIRTAYETDSVFLDTDPRYRKVRAKVLAQGSTYSMEP